MTYYAQRKSILNGVAQNACDGAEFPFDVDSIEWGTVEGGVIERKSYTKLTAQEE